MRADELQFYQHAKEVAKRVDKLDSKTPMLLFGMTAGHGLRQVRVNGREQLVGVRRLHDYLIEYHVHLLDHLGCMEKCRVLVDELISDLEDRFEVCSVCKGEQGTYDPPDHQYARKGPWRDCVTCQGRGMLPVGASEWQDEGRTFTPEEV